MHTYATLDPRPTDQARALNDAILAGATLGVEVTVRELADRCALGNIDPQHLGGDAETAAIEAALTWPLPPAGATLATVRPDADALGAMAVLLLRAGGTELTPGARERVRVIAAADKEASGPWPGARPAPAAEDLVGPATPVMHLAADHARPLGERVRVIAEWIMLGDDSPAGAAVDAYRQRALVEAREALEGLTVQAGTAVAVVTGSHRPAMSLGYRHAPVVVVANPAFRFQGGEEHLKHTVARWRTGTLRMTWAAMVDDLNAADPAAGEGARWGGSTSIVGSPQGVASGLTADQVAAIVRAHALNGLEDMCGDLCVYSDYYQGLQAAGQPYDAADAARVEADYRWVSRAVAELRATLRATETGRR